MKKSTIIKLLLLVILVIAVIAIIIGTSNQAEEQNQQIDTNMIEQNNQTQNNATEPEKEQTNLLEGKRIVETQTLQEDLNGDEKQETIEIAYYLKPESTITEAFIQEYGLKVDGIVVTIKNETKTTQYAITAEEMESTLYVPTTQIVDIQKNDHIKEIMIRADSADSSSPWDNYVFLQYNGEKILPISIMHHATLPTTVNNEENKGKDFTYLRSTEAIQIEDGIVQTEGQSKKVETYQYNANGVLELTSVKLNGDIAFYTQFLITWQGDTLNIYTEKSTQSQTSQMKILDENWELDSNFKVEKVENYWLQVSNAEQTGWMYIEDIADMCK